MDCNVISNDTIYQNKSLFLTLNWFKIEQHEKNGFFTISKYLVKALLNSLKVDWNKIIIYV